MMKPKWISATILFVLALRAADAVSLDLDREQIHLDETARLTLTVEGALENATSELPLPEGLDVQGFSRQILIRNGRRETQLLYELRARAPGEYEVGPFNLNLPDGPKQVPAVVLTVTPARAVKKTGDLFLTLESSADTALVREPLELTLTFYSINRIADIKVQEFIREGFDLGENWDEITARTRTFDGERYFVRRFVNRLVPVKAGTVELNPTFQLKVVRPGGVRREPFSMMFRTHDVETVTLKPRNPLRLEFRAPPKEGRPPDYTGHIGRFDLTASVSPDNVRAGDPVTLRIRLTGTGSIGEALPPSLEEHPGFKVYEPRLVEDDIRSDGLSGSKMMEQVVIPRDAEADRIPALKFSYYDPEREAYRTATAGPFDLVVTAGEAGGASVVGSLTGNETGNAGPKMLGEDLLYLKTEPGRLRSLSELTPGPRTAAGAGLPFVLWGLAVLILNRREARRSDPREVRRREAPRRLRKRLDRLSGTGDDPSELYGAIWNCLSGYLRDRLGLPPGELDAEEIRNRLPESIGETRRDETVEWMRRCERARFAGGEPEESPGEIRDAFGTFMRNLDREVSS